MKGKNIKNLNISGIPNICCIKVGSEEKYSSRYVNRLYRSLRSNLSIEFRFICFTEDSSGIDPEVEIFPLLDLHLTGWWHKVSLFRPEINDLEGLIWYFDLDLVVLKNIDCMYECEGEFLSIPDPSWPGEFNTSIMRFHVGSYPSIWGNFRENLQLMNGPGGDQNWINLMGINRRDESVGIKTRDLQAEYAELIPDSNLISSFEPNWINVFDSDLVGKNCVVRAIDRAEHISEACKIVLCYGHRQLPHNSWLQDYW